MDKSALYQISYGIYIVASKKGNKFNGQIANTVFQVTSEPPKIAISINKENLTWEYIKDRKVFTVSILSEDTPMAFIGKFGFQSGRETDKFAETDYIIGQTGLPVVVENTTAYLEARILDEIDVGTHTIFIGEVINAEVLSDNTCMTYNYYHQIKKGKTPKKAPSFVVDAEVRNK
jgi:flavin reductase (DIM6/NTAB) family NADH-FMN oxidoreductase RutF